MNFILKINQFFKIRSPIALLLNFIVFTLNFFPYLSIYYSCISLPSRYKIINLIHLIFLCLAFAFLLTLRHPEAGLNVGYGMDAQHYMDAFYELSHLSFENISNIPEITIPNTGSSEPLFWVISYLLSKILIEPELVWLSLAFLTLFTISFPLFLTSSRLAFIALTLYTSTITFYVFPGSGLRQGLALSFIIFSLWSLINNKIYLTLIAAISAALTHASSLPVAAIIIGIAFQGNTKKSTILQFFLIGLVFSLFYALQSDQISNKLEDYSHYSRQESALIQALIEGLFLLFLTIKFKNSFSPKLIKSFYFFILTLLMLSLFFGGAGFERYFRYMYAYSILFLVLIYYNHFHLRFYILLCSFIWLVFILATRYAGLFVTGTIINHIFYTPIINLFHNLSLTQ